MKGLIVTANHTVQLVDDIPMPEIGPYEALVRIDCCMICNGTDMEILRGQLPEATEYPLMLGHESAGHVIRIGEKVRSFQPGDQVIRACLPSNHAMRAAGAASVNTAQSWTMQLLQLTGCRKTGSVAA